MQTINKQKPVAGLARFGISEREITALAKFSNAADKLGLKTTGIGKGPFGVGCLLKMSGKADYEVILNGAGNLLLGRVENGKRVKLHGGGTNTEAQWTMVLNAVKRSEGRLQ
jgi:hypothetical protein